MQGVGLASVFAAAVLLVSTGSAVAPPDAGPTPCIRFLRGYQWRLCDRKYYSL